MGRIFPFLGALAAFAFAAALSYFSAQYAAVWIEKVTQSEVQDHLVENGYAWANVQTDGLQVILSGDAGTEAVRFKALAEAGSVVEAARLIDDFTVNDTAELDAPEFSIEVLRNAFGISVIGLIPAAADRNALVGRIETIARGQNVNDFLETADYPEPSTWSSALSFGLIAMDRLERAKISITADKVTVDAIADSREEQAKLEAELARRAPNNLSTEIDISAPRPVITPFTLRFILDADGARFDACSADTEETQAQILSAAVDAGLSDKATCQLGLGVPSKNWGAAAAKSIVTLKEIGVGSVTMTDTKIALVADANTDVAIFRNASRNLEASLPEAFELTAVLLEKPEVNDNAGPSSFTAEISENGKATIVGDVPSNLALGTIRNFAKAKFGAENVDLKSKIRNDIPEGMTLRVMAGLDALSNLHEGVLDVTLANVQVVGKSGDVNAGQKISSLLTRSLGTGAPFDLDVTYVEALDPARNLLNGEQCIVEISKITAEQKITFEPGSTNLDADSREAVGQIAEILNRCSGAEIEIAGYTDSQGRESMNQTLSQTRAEAVLEALRLARVSLTSLTATGYGEADPIADNGTEDGREANRRIEFRVSPAEEPTEEPEDEQN